MSGIFISYARSTEGEAHAVAEALREQGYEVWRDDQLPAHRAYGEVIEEQLQAAGAVVVVWSADAVKSQWVRAEADLARQTGKLVQLRVDAAGLPLPFNQIQCPDLSGWGGDPTAPAWQTIVRSLDSLLNDSATVAKPYAPPQAPAVAQPAMPSIAVMPFVNRSADPEQEFLADGVAEDLITGLSLSRSLFVISRGSSFSYKGRTVDIREVGRELGVRHVLEGSIRRGGDTLRVSVQLGDTRTGAQVWSLTLDRPVTDLFTMQDEITSGIVATLTSQLNHAVTPDVARARPDSLEAWELYRKAGINFMADPDLATLQASEAYLRQAVAMDPNYAAAWVGLGVVLAVNWMVTPHGQGQTAAPPEEARACVERAVRLAPGDPDVIFGQGRFLMAAARTKDAVPLLQQAVELNPNEVIYRLNLARAYNRTGQRSEALTETETVLKLSPRDPMAPLLAYNMAEVQFALGAYGEAETWARRSLAGGARSIRSQMVVAVSIAAQGRVEEAQAAMREVLASSASLSFVNLAQIEFVIRNLGWDEELVTDVLKHLVVAWPPELG
jgi:adenylate cyclase